MQQALHQARRQCRRRHRGLADQDALFGDNKRLRDQVQQLQQQLSASDGENLRLKRALSGLDGGPLRENVRLLDAMAATSSRHRKRIKELTHNVAAADTEIQKMKQVVRDMEEKHKRANNPNWPNEKQALLNQIHHDQAHCRQQMAELNRLFEQKEFEISFNNPGNLIYTQGVMEQNYRRMVQGIQTRDAEIARQEKVIQQLKDQAADAEAETKKIEEQQTKDGAPHFLSTQLAKALANNDVLEQAILRLQHYQGIYNDIEAERATWDDARQSLVGEIRSKEAEIDRYQRQIQEAMDHISWTRHKFAPDDHTEIYIPKSAERIYRQKRKIQALQDEINRLGGSAGNLTRNQALDNLRDELKMKREEIARLKKDLRDCWNHRRSLSEDVKAKALLEKEKDDLEKRFKNLQDTIKKLRKDPCKRWKDKIDLLERDLANARKETSRLRGGQSNSVVDRAALGTAFDLHQRGLQFMWELEDVLGAAGIADKFPGEWPRDEQYDDLSMYEERVPYVYLGHLSSRIAALAHWMRDQGWAGTEIAFDSDASVDDEAKALNKLLLDLSSWKAELEDLSDDMGPTPPPTPPTPNNAGSSNPTPPTNTGNSSVPPGPSPPPIPPGGSNPTPPTSNGRNPSTPPGTPSPPLLPYPWDFRNGVYHLSNFDYTEWDVPGTSTFNNGDVNFSAVNAVFESLRGQFPYEDNDPFTHYSNITISTWRQYFRNYWPNRRRREYTATEINNVLGTVTEKRFALVVVSELENGYQAVISQDVRLTSSTRFLFLFHTQGMNPRGEPLPPVLGHPAPHWHGMIRRQQYVAGSNTPPPSPKNENKSPPSLPKLKRRIVFGQPSKLGPSP